MSVYTCMLSVQESVEQERKCLNSRNNVALLLTQALPLVYSASFQLAHHSFFTIIHDAV